MNERQRLQLEQLKSRSSDDAATWLMQNYPVEDEEYGLAILLAAHRSWKKADQIRLANYYFQRIPFASGKPYEVFASFMSLSNFVRAIQANIPSDQSDRDLLLYHLVPVLRRHTKSVEDDQLISQFLANFSFDKESNGATS